MNGLFTKNSAVRGRGLMLALMLALVTTVSISGVATAASAEDVFIGVDGVHHVVSRSGSTQEVVVGYPSEMQDVSELNLTILRIDPRWHDMELMPGESHEFTVTVTNPNNETVLVDPIIVEGAYSEFIFDDNWITITPAATELEADGGEEEFTIAVAIPDDADLGHYGIRIAFTDDAKPDPFPEPRSYPSYINTLNLDIEVWEPPVVQFLPSRIQDRVESGKGYDYAITLTNTGDYDIDIDPELGCGGRYYDSRSTTPAFEDDAITIDAPASVPANGTATVSVHLEVPAGAKGRYNGEINLGIDDPSMGRWGEEGGTVRLRFGVWEQPTEPFLKAFELDTDAPITILVESRKYMGSGMYGTDGGDRGDCEPYFNLTLEGPDGTATLAPTMVTYHGAVSLSGRSKYGYAPSGEMGLDEVYAEGYTSYTEEYLASGTIGNWEIGILPHYVEEFEYTIAIGDAP